MISINFKLQQQSNQDFVLSNWIVLHSKVWWIAIMQRRVALPPSHFSAFSYVWTLPVNNFISFLSLVLFWMQIIGYGGFPRLLLQHSETCIRSSFVTFASCDRRQSQHSSTLWFSPACQHGSKSGLCLFLCAAEQSRGSGGQSVQEKRLKDDWRWRGAKRDDHSCTERVSDQAR